MFRNVLAAALSNLVRNRLYAAISVLGLAVAMTTVIVIGLYIRDELMFDRFVPGYEDVYVMTHVIKPPGREPLSGAGMPAPIYGWLKQDYPELKAVARLVQITPSVRRGAAEYLDPVAWVDPDFFKVLPIKAIAGDPDAAMQRPDGVVLTRSAARKYFGQDRPIGQTLEVNRVITLRVGAVLDDPPANSHLSQGIFASGLNALSAVRRSDAIPLARGNYPAAVTAYVRATPAAAARLQADMAGFTKRHLLLPNGKLSGGTELVLSLTPLRDLHMTQFRNTAVTGGEEQGNPQVLAAVAIIGLLILVMAGINFVNLMTARAGQRMVEVGIRKLAGAQRRHLVMQFLGEALIYAFLGLLVAAALAELLLPRVRAALDRPLDFNYWRDPALLGVTVLATTLIGVLAGVYPAFVQSAFRPAAVLKGGIPATRGGLAVREGLVVTQFAVLIGLLLSMGVIALQTRFVLKEGLKLKTDAILMLDMSIPPDFSKPVSAPRRILCREAFAEQVRRLPGVKGVSCASPSAMDMNVNISSGRGPSGETVALLLAPIDYGFFELYGLKPVAGRFFSQPADEIAPVTPPPLPRFVIINETAARLMGFRSATQAVGKTFLIGLGPRGTPPVQIVGVAPDVDINSMQKETAARVYTLNPPIFGYMHIKLDGGHLPETVKAIEGAWRATGVARPPRHRFVDDLLREIYTRVIVQGVVIDVLCGIALFIGCLGLFGLAAFTAERRTKEIGVRKVMGASRTDIVQLLLWSFTRPVLWANVIAWPVGWWAMSRWLQGFSTRIDLSPLFFIGAGALALLIAALTVSAHAFRIAQAKPVGALRYE